MSYLLLIAISSKSPIGLYLKVLPPLQSSFAKKIFDGGNKTVCAWVLCDEVVINTSEFLQLDTYCHKFKYNPRVQPNWLLGGEVVDNNHYDTIGSVDCGLYLI